MQARRGKWYFGGLVVLCFILGNGGVLCAKEKAKKPHELSVTHNNRGVTELYRGNAQRALFEFQTAVEIDPTYVEGQTNVGVAYKLLGQYDAAKAAFEKAISLDKSYAAPYNHLGTVYYTLGDYQKAIDLLETSTKKNKKFADAWLNLGLAYIALANKNGGDVTILRQAIEPLRKATDIDTSYSRAHQELAQLYQRLGDLEKATIRYKLALETNNTSLDSWIQLAKLYYEKEELLQAKNALAQAIALSPQSIEAHQYLGMVYLKEANYPLASTEFQTVIRYAPSSERGYFNIGYTYFLLGNQQQEAGNTQQASSYYQQATTAYIQAVQLNPDFADAAYNAGYTYSLLKDFANAEKWYAAALAGNPKHYRSLLALGLLAQDRGQPADANRYLCQVKAEHGKTISQQELSLVESLTSSNGGCR